MSQEPLVCQGLLIIEASRSHSVWHTTFPGTPLDEWSARRRDLYLTARSTHSRQASMAPAGFLPAIPAGARPQTYALYRAAMGWTVSFNSPQDYMLAKFLLSRYQTYIKLAHVSHLSFYHSEFPADCSDSTGTSGTYLISLFEVQQITKHFGGLKCRVFCPNHASSLRIKTRAENSPHIRH
jgi:hypothetical protein